MELLAAGREADVYALGADRVLRRYRRPADTSDEAALMTYLAGHGFPVPRVYQAGGLDLVMERVAGPTLLRQLIGGQVTPAAGAVILADLHERLHAVPAGPGAEPGHRIIHLDLHPDNVIMTGAGPVLIDWPNGTDGPPDYDVAVTALILAEVAVGLHVPEFAEPAAELLAAFLTASLAAATPATPPTTSCVDHGPRHMVSAPGGAEGHDQRGKGAGGLPYLAQALAYRTSNPTLRAEEKAKLAEAAQRINASLPRQRLGKDRPALS